jgi:hypothetical protein
VIVYLLEPQRGAWAGWVVTTAPYRERPVAVPDLTVLPAEARVYLGAERWRR